MENWFAHLKGPGVLWMSMWNHSQRSNPKRGRTFGPARQTACTVAHSHPVATTRRRRMHSAQAQRYISALCCQTRWHTYFHTLSSHCFRCSFCILLVANLSRLTLLIGVLLSDALGHTTRELRPALLAVRPEQFRYVTVVEETALVVENLREVLSCVVTAPTSLCVGVGRTPRF